MMEFKELEEKLNGKFNYASPTTTMSNLYWLNVESSDGFNVSVDMRLGGFALSSNYNPSRENGTGESLVINLDSDEVIKVMQQGVKPLFRNSIIAVRHKFNKDSYMNNNKYVYSTKD